MRSWWIAFQIAIAVLLFVSGAVIALDARYLGVKGFYDFVRVTEYAIFGEPKTIKFSESCFFEGSRFGSAVLGSNRSGCIPDPVEADENIERLGDFADYSIYRQMAKSVGRLDLQYTDAKGVRRIAPCTTVMVTDRILLTALHCFMLPDVASLERFLRSGDDMLATLHFGFVSEIEDQGTFSEVVDIRVIDHGIKELLREDGGDAFNDYLFYEITPEASANILAAGFGPAEFSADPIRAKTDFFVIHHPLGSVLHISRKSCRAEESEEQTSGEQGESYLPVARFKHYCGTLPGTSGAPIFDNDTHRVVALHLAGRRDVVRLTENEGDAIPIAMIANDLKDENADLKRVLLSEAKAGGGDANLSDTEE